MTRYAAFVEKTRKAVLQPGHLDPAIRRAILDGGTTGIPADLLAYVQKVRRNAWAIEDPDVQQLLSAGYSEDQVFEATATAALGASLHRLKAGMDALKGRVS